VLPSLSFNQVIWAHGGIAVKRGLLKGWRGPLGLGVILLLALLLRLPGFDRPPQLGFGPLYQDELKMMTNTVKVMNGNALLPHWPYGIYRLMEPQFQVARVVYSLRCGRSLLAPVSTGDLRRLIEADLDRFFLLIRGHALLLGLGIVALTFVIGRRVSGDAGGIASAVVVAVTPLMVSYSRMMYYDIAMVMFLLFYIIAFAKALRERSIGHVYVAVALSAVAFTMKQNAVVLFLADAFLVMVVVGRWRPWRVLMSRHTWWLALMMLLILWYGYPTMFSVDGLTSFADSVGSKYYGTTEAVTLDQRLWWLWLSRVWVDQAPPLVFVVLVLGTVIGLLVARDRYVAGSVLGIGLLYYAVAGYSTHAIDRTMLPLIPLLAIGMAGWVALLQRLTPRRVGTIMTAGLLVLVIAPLVQNSVRVNLLLTLPDSRAQVARWFLDNVPDGTGIARETYAPHLPALRPVNCPAGIEAAIGDGKHFTLTFRNSLASEPPDWYPGQGIRYLIHMPANYDRLLRQQAEGFVESPTDTSARRMGKTPRYGVPIAEAIARYDALQARYEVVERYTLVEPPKEIMQRCAAYRRPSANDDTGLDRRCAEPSFDTWAGVGEFLVTGWLVSELVDLWHNRHRYLLGRDTVIYDTGIGG